ncbi:MAG: hypothetical protein R3176_01190 [Woeseiaceae bacterium]|nr:hypothetical protein [Woeseiaceae bacterium]
MRWSGRVARKDAADGQTAPIALASDHRGRHRFDFERIIAWFLGEDENVQYGEVRMRARSDIEGLLAERTFYATFVTRQLAAIETTQARILAKLAAIEPGD